MTVNQSGYIKYDFEVTSNGGIVISQNSMKKDIFTKAKQFDSDSNGLLENSEIRQFLESFKDVKSRAYLYDEDINTSGDITRRSFLNKYDSHMCFNYENGENEPSSVVLNLTQKDIDLFKYKYKEHHINLKTMQVEAFNDKNSTDRVTYNLSEQECQGFINMATIKNNSWFDKLLKLFLIK